MTASLASPTAVVRGLITYTDWWQPSTGSVIPVGAARRDRGATDGLAPGLLDTLDDRAELSRRMRSMDDRDRQLLFLWYVQQLTVAEIAAELRVSRRHCFRLRGDAIRRLVELGDPDHRAA
ncbi:MAG TPA: sigma factor-like helix-turn-helix DNA-binding protein [Actinomycetota bacterium]|jgi:DNA-directed RNA polymerase specialized sigma24 family protein